MHQNSVWKEILGTAIFVFFAASGVAHVVYPGRFMKRWHRKGGEMLTEWNRLGIQVFGAILAVFAIYALYDILRD